MADDSGTVVLLKDQRLKGSENYDLWSSCLMVLLWFKGFEDHYPKKLEEYKVKWFSKKKEKKSEDKPKKSNSKDKSNIVNLNFASLIIVNLMAFSMFTHNQWITDTSVIDHIINNLNWFDSSSYLTYFDLHLMETDNGFALIVGVSTIILKTTCLDVNIFRALRLLVQNDDAYVISSGIFDKNNIEYNAVITSLAGIYLRLTSILTVLISAFPAHQTILSLDIIHQCLAYASLEVIKNTIKATLGIDVKLVKKASNEDLFLCEACECNCSEKGVSQELRKRSTKVGEVLNINMCTVTLVSYNGHHYAITIVDDCSSAT
ncbi:hypothetical protein B7463_g1940, partial [Scytalidium lignicola]